jgi:mycoredoxin
LLFFNQIRNLEAFSNEGIITALFYGRVGAHPAPEVISLDSNVTVFGADWCKDTDRTLRALKFFSLPYEYINIDLNPMGKEEVQELNNGEVKIPTVVIEGVGTQILSVPSDEELREALMEAEVLRG